MFDPIKYKPCDRTGRGACEKFCVASRTGGRCPGAMRAIPSDNVPGVPGIGIKTAAAAHQYRIRRSSIRCWRVPGEIKQPKRRQCLIDFAEQARISRRAGACSRTTFTPPPMPAPTISACMSPSTTTSWSIFSVKPGIPRHPLPGGSRADSGEIGANARITRLSEPSQPRRPDLRALPAQLGVRCDGTDGRTSRAALRTGSDSGRPAALDRAGRPRQGRHGPRYRNECVGCGSG